MEKSKYIDHTLLAANASKAQIDNIIEEAIKYNFATVCINPSWIKHAKSKLNNSEVGITTVIGFPLGSSTTETKVFEAKDAIDKGADEIDMVMNIGMFLDKEYKYIEDEINSIKASIGDKVLKVIVETALLNAEEIAKISDIVSNSKADFIKTSTGFSTRGASLEDVKIMSENINNETTLIKAAGGVRSPEDLDAMIKAGASRIGTSKGVSLIDGKSSNKGY